MLIKKLFFTSLFLGLILEVKAEYIIYKKTSEGIEAIKDTVLHKRLYHTLLKFQWPTSIAYFHEMDSAEVEKYTLPIASLEENYIRTKIKEINKDLDIAFIPTSFYELFFIAHQNKNSKIGESPAKLELSNIIYNYKNCPSSLFSYFSSYNQNENLQNTYFVINNELVSFIKSFTPQPQTNLSIFIEKNIERLLNNLFNYGDNSPLWNKDIFKRTFEIEYKAHKNNLGILYRGTLDLSSQSQNEKLTPIEITYLDKNFNIDYSFISALFTAEELLHLKELIDQENRSKLTSENKNKLINLTSKLYTSFEWLSPSRSISYGNSFLAGYFLDPGACAFNYCIKSYTLGYSLFINKWLYYKGACSKEHYEGSQKIIDGQLFVISPLHTIAGLWGYGELFHSRSVSYYYPNDYLIKNSPSKKIYIVGLGYHKLEKIDYLVKSGNPLKRGAELANFIAERAHFIKLPDTNGGFAFFKPDAQKYLTAQKNMAELFDYMAAIEPTLMNTMHLP